MPLTGTGRRRRRSTKRSLSAYERELRRAQRQQEIAQPEHEIAKVAQTERELVSAHLEEFPLAQPQQAPDPTPVDRSEILRDLRKEALSGISFFKRSERRAAREAADEPAEHAIRAEERRRAEEQAKEQARLDAAWQQLLNNEPQVVLSALEAAFEDNQAPAAPIDCQDDEVTVLMLYESPEMIPDNKPALTPAGKPTLRKRNKTERNELYATSLASNVLATAKEAFAVAPGINRVIVMVARKDESPQPERPVLYCLYCGSLERSRFDRIDWSSVDPLEEISNTPEALIERKGRAAEVVPLNLSDEPDLAAVLRAAAEAVGGEANIAPTANKRKRDSQAKPSSHSASQSAPGGDIPDQIRRLAELRDAGALTNEEFEAKKKDLLDRM